MSSGESISVRGYLSSRKESGKRPSTRSATGRIPNTHERNRTLGKVLSHQRGVSPTVPCRVVSEGSITAGRCGCGQWDNRGETPNPSIPCRSPVKRNREIRMQGRFVGGVRTPLTPQGMVLANYTLARRRRTEGRHRGIRRQSRGVSFSYLRHRVRVIYSLGEHGQPSVLPAHADSRDLCGSLSL